jgi:hypothetical protein
MSETITQPEPNYLRERLAEMVESWRERAYEDSDDAFASGLTEAREGVEALLAGVPAEARDHADDAAWPLPDGWGWAPVLELGDVPLAMSTSSSLRVRVVLGDLRITDAALGSRTVPAAVVRTLLARWEAGQAPQDHPDGCYTNLGGTRDCNGDGHFMCRSCARYDGEAGQPSGATATAGG